MNVDTSCEVSNYVRISGKLIDLPKYKTSPAGYETSHFNIWHESKQQQITGGQRAKHKVDFSLPVSVAMPELIAKLKAANFVKADLRSYQLDIKGYLAQRLFSNGEKKLVVHAIDIGIEIR